jgi:hypothetical protein
MTHYSSTRPNTAETNVAMLGTPAAAYDEYRVLCVLSTCPKKGTTPGGQPAEEETGRSIRDGRRSRRMAPVLAHLAAGADQRRRTPIELPYAAKTPTAERETTLKLPPSVVKSVSERLVRMPGDGTLLLNSVLGVQTRTIVQNLLL